MLTTDFIIPQNTKKGVLQSTIKSDCKKKGKEKKGFATPNSNTGSNLTSSPKPPDSKVDWLSLCGKKITFENFTKIINNFIDGTLFGKQFESKEYESHYALFKGAKPFEKTFKNQLGIKVNAKYSEEYNNYELQIFFSGSVLSELVGLNNHLLVGKILKFSRSVGLHTSRIDLAINDYQKNIEIKELYDWTKQGYLCKFLKAKYIDSYEPKDNQWGESIYFGSRQSDVSLTVYDMFYKHRIVGNRWELELHDKKAQLVENVLIAEYQNYENEIAELKANNKEVNVTEIENKYNATLIEYILNVILTAIDFKDKTEVGSNGNIGKLPSLEKFQAFRRYINVDYEKMPLQVEVKKSDLKSKFEWAVKSVKGAMAIFKDGLGIKAYKTIEKLLYKIDKAKTKPPVVQKDNELMIAELKSKGFNALMTNEEITEYSKKYDIDFGFMHTDLGYEKEWKRTIKQKNLKEFNKPSAIFTKLFETDISGLFWIFEYLPTEFENILKHFKPIERDELINAYSSWRELNLA